MTAHETPPAETSPKRSDAPVRTLSAALLMGWVFDALFYGREPGISVLLFVSGLLGVLFYLGRRQGVRPAWRNLWLLPPLLFFASMVAIRGNLFLNLLNVCAVLVLLGLTAYFYSSRRVARLGLFGYPVVLALVSSNALVSAAPLVSGSVNAQAARRVSMRYLLPVLRGLLLALPVLSLFTCLLASADLIFAQYIASVFRQDFLLSYVREMLLRVALIAGVAWVIAGGLVYTLSHQQANSGGESWESALAAVPRKLSLGFIEVTTLLVLVNALFLTFGWVQFAYLFGGNANITVEGYTYAEYARRGFFELVAVAVLTLGMILGLQWLGWRETARHRLAFNGLATLMVALVMVLLASAFWRMMLYEEAYGYTHLRLYVHLFEMWLAAAFVWLVITLWVRQGRFGIGAFVAMLLFLAATNVANPDALIAQQNLARWERTHNIDIEYLAGLSDDAVPVMVPYLDRLEKREARTLRQSLSHRLEKMSKEGQWREWQSFNLARWRAYDALVHNQDQLTESPNMGPGAAVP